MSEKRNAVKVTIVGEEYTIRSDETPEHTRAVAEHVDQAIRQVMESGQVVEANKAAILAALQITDELLRARQTRDDLLRDMEALSGEVERWLPPAKRTGEHAAIGG